MMTVTNGTKLGRYEVRSKIGAGGMGEVYLAQDTKLDRKVALKVLPGDIGSDKERLLRFEPAGGQTGIRDAEDSSSTDQRRSPDDPNWNPLRDDARFMDLLKRLNLPE